MTNAPLEKAGIAGGIFKMASSLGASMGVAIGLAIATGLWPSGAAAQAPGRIVVLPSPFSPLRPTPPLPIAGAATETRFPGRLFSSQAVRVSVDGSGTPFT